MYHSNNKKKFQEIKMKKNDIINYSISEKKTWTEIKIHTNDFETWFSTVNLYFNLIKCMFPNLASRKLQLSHNTFKKPFSMHG